MWEQRWHPLRQEWVIVAAHRQSRPWSGGEVRATAAAPPAYDPQCYLCPGNARVSGKTSKGTIMVEVACADGLKGYMIEYNTAPAVSAVGATACAFAGGCQLPGNV